MNDPCIICVAITGSVPTKEDNPAVPISISEQIESTQECFELGASIVHCHVRNDDGTPSIDPNKYRNLKEGIEKYCPGMIIQLSTGGRSVSSGDHLRIARGSPVGRPWRFVEAPAESRGIEVQEECGVRIGSVPADRFEPLPGVASDLRDPDPVDHSLEVRGGSTITVHVGPDHEGESIHGPGSGGGLRTDQPAVEVEPDLPVVGLVVRVGQHDEARVGDDGLLEGAHLRRTRVHIRGGTRA